MAKLRSIEPVLAGASARYRHYVQCRGRPDATEAGRLDDLLSYGEPFDPRPWQGAREVLVVPRPGTMSPWSSKATDIARNCGFHWVERIERGLLHLLRFDGLREDASGRSLAALVAHLHDRMTESVIDAASAA